MNTRRDNTPSMAPFKAPFLPLLIFFIAGMAGVEAGRILPSLRDSVRYHISFDAGVEPDTGDLTVREVANAQLSTGKSGNGYLVPGGADPDVLNGVSYTLKDHPLSSPGALSFWLAPVNWSDPGEVNGRGSIYLFRLEMAGGAKLLIQRQGFQTEPPKRQDYFIVGLYGLKDLGAPAHCLGGTKGWRNGEHHLVVVNWDLTGLELSVDGNAFRRIAFQRPLVPAQDCPSGRDYDLVIGRGDAAPETTLLDEVVFYRRPLAPAEVRSMYTSAPPAPASPASENWTSEPWSTDMTLPVLDPNHIPTVDGVIGEGEWSHASRLVGAFSIGPAQLHFEGRRYIAWTACDGQTLYLAMRTELPADDDLRSTVSPQGDSDLIQAWRDDSIELWLTPDRDNPSGESYQIVVNSLGTLYDVRHDPTQKEKAKRADASFRVQWAFANSTDDTWWHIEIAMPLAQFGISALPPEQPLGLHLVRNWKSPNVQADHTAYLGAFSNPRKMGRLRIGGKGPVVRQMHLREENTGKADLRFEIVNPHERPISVYVDGYSHSGSGNPEKLLKGLFTIPGTGSKVLTLDRSHGSGQYRNSLEVTSEDREDVYFARKFIWKNERPPTSEKSSSRSKLKFRFGYYPSFHRIRARLDVSRLPDRDRATRGHVSVRAKQSGTVIVQGPFPTFVGHASETVLDVPALQEGDYLIEATLLGKDGKEMEAVTQDFTRKHFPWENNDLGITDEVIPPFTPIEVEGKRVSTVLRTHTLNDTGLLDSIVSEGKTVLAAPMHFDVVVDGAQHEVSPRPVVFTQTKSNAVKHTTTWHAGPLVVALDGVWDYDGLLKCEMHLDLPETSTLDKLDLVIPVKPEIAKYLHVASDRMRLSVHKRLPTSSSGSEPVWQSNTVAHNDMPDSDDVVGRLPGTFVPYVWLGNERQGICWVADNDSGWLVDDVQSTHAVYRQEDSVLLRVSFVTKPGPLKARRRIVFGLQATPAKPMPRRPDHWRRMVFSLASKEFSSLCNLTIFGSAFQWGGPDFYAMYPRGKDFGIYSTIKNTRATGRLDRAVLDDWLKGYDETNPYLDIIKRNIGKVHSCKSKPDVVIPYTDVRGASVTEEAFDTFQDEWLIYEFGKRTWPTFTDPALGYVISTTPSRQDYILHYFKRMLDAGAFDAIYFDCPYPKAVRNTVTSGAYIDEHGRKRASADIFEMRELFKRCAVLAHQKRGYNMNIAHMSTVNVVPLLSWFGVNLDWEFNYGQDDFQDRGFSRDYTRIVTIGQQTGTTPLVLGSLGIRGQDPATLARARRTLAGCLLAHEVKDWAVAWGKDRTYKDALKILYDFGYGTNATVYNDWSDGFPAAISGTETAILLLVRDGEALLVVTDYGNGGTCELTLDATNVTLLPGGAFYNALSGERLQAAGASSCRFSLPKHDFRIIHYR